MGETLLLEQTGVIVPAPMEIKFKKLVPEAQTPFRKIDVDAGFDLYAVRKEEKLKYVVYSRELHLKYQ